MNRKQMAVLSTLAASSLFWCGCVGPGGEEATAAQKLGGSFSVEMTMMVEDMTATGTLCRVGEGVWRVAFAEPSSLSGVELDFQNGEVSASYKGLAFSVPQTAMPAKSVLLQLITVVDTLAQEDQISGVSKDDYVLVEGELEGAPYELKLTENGDLTAFSMDSYDAELTFEKFQSGKTDIATQTTEMTVSGTGT